MEIILKKDVKNLGYADELVNVKPGFARNYLIPKGLALVASESNKKVLAETQKQRAYKEAKIKEAAEKIEEALKSMAVKVPAKAGESGKIFGSVTSVQLAEALKKLGYEVDRRVITIQDEPVKTLGKYKANIRLHKEVNFEIDFEVIEG